MPVALARAASAVALSACLIAAAGCGGLLGPEYEYAEDIDLSIDGAARVDVNASVAALVALHGLALDTDPVPAVDLDRVREFFEAPGVEVLSVRQSRRAGRRFVHVALRTADIHVLGRGGPLAWSTYSFERQGDLIHYRQVVGEAAGRTVGAVGWTGDEQVAFRVHLPSEIPFHNAPSRRIERGNILVWTQPLTARLSGTPVDIQVQMEPESILYRTLLLFGLTILLAAAAFAVVIWRVARGGRA